MSKKTAGLGKGIENLGLHELIAGMKDPVPVADRVDVDVSQKGLNYVPINRLSPGKYQPRKTMDDDTLLELAQSIREHGIIQPILVRLVTDNSGYEIVAGERRWRAAKLANLQNVPVLIKTMDDQVSAAVALIENIQREDLNVIDEAEGLQQLIDKFQLTHQTLAKVVGKSRASITNSLRILGADVAVQEALKTRQISMGHARALLTANQQSDIVNKVVTQGLSVRATEALVKKSLSAKSVVVKKPIRFATKEQELAALFGTKVVVRSNSSGSGQIQIQFCSKSHLEAIMAVINSKNNE